MRLRLNWCVQVMRAATLVCGALAVVAAEQRYPEHPSVVDVTRGFSVQRDDAPVQLFRQFSHSPQGRSRIESGRFHDSSDDH